MRLANSGALVALMFYLLVGTATATPGTDPSDPGYDTAAMSLIHAPDAWGVTTGDSSIVIAVLDSGVAEIPDLKSALALPGLDGLSGGTNTTDHLGHGTAMASIAAAPHNNGQGIAGVCGRCRILPVRVLDDNNVWYVDELAQSINFAVEHGARVINLSLNGINPPAIAAAISAATNRGVVVVISAGNQQSSSESANQLASGNPEAIRVAATGRSASNLLGPLSNHGPWVDTAAPTPVEADRLDGSHDQFQGTSAGAAEVSGAVGLLLSYKPSLTPAQVKDILVCSGTYTEGLDIGDSKAPKCPDGKPRSGRVLNAYNALIMAGYKPPTPPPPPPVKKFKLTVKVTGHGTVTTIGVRCLAGVSTKTCYRMFGKGKLTLLATPLNKSYRLKSWGGACHGTSTRCTIMFTKATLVTAVFVKKS